MRDEYRRHFRFFQTIHMRSRDDKQHWVALEPYKELEWSLGQSTECPACYTSVDEHEDLERRDELFKKWKRAAAPSAYARGRRGGGASLRAYRGVPGARSRDSKHIKALRELGDKCTAAEQSELDAFEARYRHVRSNSVRLVAP